MPQDRYSARIGESSCIAQDLPYGELVSKIVEYTARAAMARSRDDSNWEQEQLRRGGLACLQLFRNGKAIWSDPETFRIELDEVCREHAEARFKNLNQLDPELYSRLEVDVRARWRRIGYETGSLMLNMKNLYNELQRDFADRAGRAMERLLEELLSANSMP